VEGVERGKDVDRIRKQIGLSTITQEVYRGEANTSPLAASSAKGCKDGGKI